MADWYLVIDLESVPGSLKQRVVIPVYKGSGKDPVLVESYGEIVNHDGNFVDN